MILSIIIMESSIKKPNSLFLIIPQIALKLKKKFKLMFLLWIDNINYIALENVKQYFIFKNYFQNHQL